MKTILITGANRGIGLEFVQQCSELGDRVVACCRDPHSAEQLQTLAQHNDRISIHRLDVTQLSDIDALCKELDGVTIDWLINNAGTSGEQGVTIGNIDRDNFIKVLETNCFATLKLSDALLPSIQASNEKLIVVISSRMGSIADNERGRSYAYRTSKAAVNCVMRSFAIDVADDGVNVMLIHPGWVKTDMGGDEALVSTEQSVTKMLQQIAEHGASDHAQVLRSFDGSEIPW